MNSVDRRKRIMDELTREGFVSNSQLAERLNVSIMTIRRDLNYFSAEGIVTINHGGASLNNGSFVEKPVFLKQEENVNEKERIAKLCGNFVNPGDVVYLDCGTTCYEIARILRHKESFVAITSSLLAMNVLAPNEKISLMSVPGGYRSKSFGFVGGSATEFIQNLNIDILFLATEGFDAVEGLSVPDSEDADIKRALIKRSNKVILVADSSKQNKTFFRVICNWKDIDIFVTDEGIEDSIIKKIKENGTEVFIV